MGKKVTYLRSKVPGLTINLEGGTSQVLDAGETIEARKVSRAMVEALEEGRVAADAELAELVELEPDESDADSGETPQPEAGEETTTKAALGELESDDDEEESEEDAEDDGDGDDGGGEDLYDPTQHQVAEVLEYLKTADADEVARVKAAEAASSRNSTQVAAYEAA